MGSSAVRLGLAERGSYGFAQNMLRQVAYDTLSRRDRKARHLAVAAHLRAAFPGDGEEVTDVIARHCLDALDAVPGDPDAEQIRGQAIAALIRAGERAVRTGAPARAAASYAAAARLTQADAPDGQQAAAALWEHASGASLTSADYAEAVEQAGQAGELYRQGSDARSAARAQVIAGRALRGWGRHAQAREQLTADGRAVNISGSGSSRPPACVVSASMRGLRRHRTSRSFGRVHPVELRHAITAPTAVLRAWTRNRPNHGK